jgi:K+-sensing histidine kinase KdpD
VGRLRAMGRSSVHDWTTRLGQHPLLRHRPLLALLFSLGVVGATVAIRLAAGDWLQGVPFLTLFSAVALSTFVGGWAVGLFATVLGGVAAAFFIVPPIGVLAIRTAYDVTALAGYAITCGVIVLIIHITIRVGEANVALAAQRQVLLMELHHRDQEPPSAARRHDRDAWAGYNQRKGPGEAGASRTAPSGRGVDV